MIKVYATSLKTRSFVSSNLYEYKPKGKIRWLQCICFWILDKLKCHALLPNTEAERVLIDPKKIMDNIIAQKSNIIRHNYDRGSELEIFIGPEQLNKLRHENNHFMTLEAPFMINGRFLGMHVTIVDWMEGVLVVPKRRMIVGR